MSAAGLRRWSAIHRWTSLVCTLFLLMLCLTGLPLVFREEIGDWLDDGPAYAALPPDTPRASLDAVVALAERTRPSDVVTSLFVDRREPRILVFMASSWPAFRANPKDRYWLRFDARTGELLEEGDRSERRRGRRIMDVVLGLHRDLLGGLTGELLLGSMALSFVASLVSGVVLYGPFMRRLPFGAIRTARSRRLKWLDLHNLLGIAAAAWMLVVGVTGTINELSTPLFGIWQKTDVQAILKPWRGQPVPTAQELSPVDAAFQATRRALPGMDVVSLFYPGSPFGTSSHYLIWAKGVTPLTSRLFTPVLVDARTGVLTAVVEMPWYLRALEIARPLHFGDYGGLPLKVLWALLDLVTIVVLIGGLYLWVARRRTSVEARLAEVEASR